LEEIIKTGNTLKIEKESFTGFISTGIFKFSFSEITKNKEKSPSDITFSFSKKISFLMN
jgi:hypothetical protein